MKDEKRTQKASTFAKATADKEKGIRDKGTKAKVGLFANNPEI